MTCCVLQNGAGFGAGTVGSMPFGTGVSGQAIGLCSATAETANSVIVTFVGDIGIPNRCDPDSPMNRQNWVLTPLEPGVCIRLIQKVEYLEPNQFRLYFDGTLCHESSYQLESLVAQSGCETANFNGLQVDPAAKETDVRDDDGFIRDIANPQLASDALMSGKFLALGTFEITDTGDLAQDYGERSLRKRLIRRATTALNEFFHLRGYGIEAELKTLLKPDLLRRVQEKMRAQCLREPEVATMQVTIYRVASETSVAVVKLQAKTSTGQTVNASIAI